MDIHYTREYFDRNRQLLNTSLRPLDFLTGPWNSVEEFENFLVEQDIPISSLPEGTNIRVVNNNSVTEYYRINGQWTSSKSNVSITVDEDNEELIINN